MNAENWFLLTNVVVMLTEAAGLFPYMKRYWILVTITAFLLVSFIGDVTIFKMVYMLFFLLFLLCYEVSITECYVCLCVCMCV